MKIAHDKLKDVMKQFNDENAGQLLVEAGIKTPPSVIFIFDDAHELRLSEHRVEGRDRLKILQRALQILPQAPNGRLFTFIIDEPSEILHLPPSTVVQLRGPDKRVKNYSSHFCGFLRLTYGHSALRFASYLI